MVSSKPHIHRQISVLSIFLSVLMPTLILVIFSYIALYTNSVSLRVFQAVSGVIFFVGTILAILVSRMFVIIDQSRVLSQHLAAIGESVDDALIGRDLKGRITSWNLGAEKVYGYKEGEVIGKPFSLLIPPEQAREFDDLVEQLKKGNRIHHYETVRTKKDGTKIIVSINVAPVLDIDGKILGAATIAHDITDRKMLERSRDTFFAIASHELRTPLTAIRGNTALIRDNFYENISLDKDVKEMVDDIHESSVRLIGIVNDFLDVSSLELGKIRFNKDKVNISELIYENWREYKSLADSKHIVFEIKSDYEMAPVIGDRGRIGQVLSNLVLNAINYTNQGSITVELKKNGNFAEVIIQDTGIGIAKENQKLLFQKFQQAGLSVYTRDTTKGTGVGLYLARLLVNGMGGEVDLVYSELGKGSIFRFTLPLDNSDNSK